MQTTPANSQSGYPTKDSSTLRTTAGVSQAQTCPHCGGSGTLRMGDQQFRTCLECLGQGQLPGAVQGDLLFPAFSAAVFSARAR
jgi:DnaJ-class molecular chaperone